MTQHTAVHFEIGGPDEKALVAFYTKVFGWTVDGNNPMNYNVVHKPDGGIGGGIMTPPDGSNYTTIYFTCGDDVAGKLAEAKAQGGTEIMGVMDVPEGPTIAMFADLDGLPLGLVNGTPDMQAPVQGTGAPVCWWEIQASDPTKSTEFLTRLFGWTPGGSEEYREIAGAGNGIGGGIGAAQQGPAFTIYIAVDDLDKALSDVEGAGGKALVQPFQPPGGPKIAMFGDPAGNSIGLVLASSMGQN